MLSLGVGFFGSLPFALGRLIPLSLKVLEIGCLRIGTISIWGISCEESDPFLSLLIVRHLFMDLGCSAIVYVDN